MMLLRAIIFLAVLAVFMSLAPLSELTPRPRYKTVATTISSYPHEGDGTMGVSFTVKESRVVLVETSPEYKVLSLMVESLYENHISNSQSSMPSNLEIRFIEGQHGQEFMNWCGCIGLFNPSLPHMVFVIPNGDGVETSRIVAHEFVHVIQYQSGRLNTLPDELAEMEAYYLSDVVFKLMSSYKGDLK